MIEALNAYLEIRRKGTRKIPPETLTDQSPLIRNESTNKIQPVILANISYLVHKLFFQNSMIKKREAKRYQVRPHSIRKYFRTQLGATNAIPIDYVEYWMGHTVSTYNDIKMKGVEFLRNLYASSGLSIKPKTKVSKIDQLRLIIGAWGMDPNEILSRKALSMPNRTVADPEQEKIGVLNQALKQAIIKELQETQSGL